MCVCVCLFGACIAYANVFSTQLSIDTDGHSLCSIVFSVIIEHLQSANNIIIQHMFWARFLATRGTLRAMWDLGLACRNGHAWGDGRAQSTCGRIERTQFHVSTRCLTISNERKRFRGQINQYWNDSRKQTCAIKFACRLNYSNEIGNCTRNISNEVGKVSAGIHLRPLSSA